MAKDSKVFAKNDVVTWFNPDKGYEGAYDVASVNKTKKTANLKVHKSFKAKVPYKAIPWSELTHRKERGQMSYERYRSMEDGGGVDGQTFRSAVLWAQNDIHENYNYENSDLNIQHDLMSDHTELYKAAHKFGIHDEDDWREIYETAFKEIGVENPPQFAKGGKMASGGSINNYDWKSKPLTLRTSDWEKRINYPRYHNFNGKTYNLIYNFNSKAEALRKIKDIGMTDTILQPIKYSDGKGGGLPKYFVYVSSDSADQYAKGGGVAAEDQIYVLKDEDGNQLFRGKEELDEYLEEFNSYMDTNYKTYEDFNKGEQGGQVYRKIIRTYAKGGKMAHGGKVLSPKQRMFKNVLEDLEKQGHLDMPNPTRDIHHIASTSVTTSTGVKNQLKELRRLKHLDLSDNNINIIASKFGKRKMASGGAFSLSEKERKEWGKVGAYIKERNKKLDDLDRKIGRLEAEYMDKYDTKEQKASKEAKALNKKIYALHSEYSNLSREADKLSYTEDYHKKRNSGKMADGGSIGKAKKGNKFKDEQDVMGWSDAEAERFHKSYKKHYGSKSIDDVISYVKSLDSKNEENEKLNIESDIVYYYPQKDLDKYEKEIGFTKSPLFKKGGKMASGGLFDSEGRKYSKKHGEFLTSEWFSGDLDFLNY